MSWTPQRWEIWEAHLRENGWHPRGSTQLQIPCPIRQNHPGGDQHPSFSFSPEKDVGHCFAAQCDAIIEGEALWALTGGGRPPVVPHLPDRAVQRYVPRWPGTLHSVHRQWLHERGFADDVIQAARLGSGKWGLGIPWWDRHGRLLWVNWRTFGDPKYHAEKGSPKSQSLYGWPLLPPKTVYVLLVEAELDALWCLQQNLPAVAMGGSSCTRDQQQQLRQFGVPILICTDGDAAGEAAKVKITEQLGRQARSAPLLPGNPRQYDRDALLAWVSQALPGSR